MRLPPAQILFLSLQLVTVCDEALHNLTPFLADRTILFLQLLTLLQVSGKSHPPQTITPRPVIPPKSTHSSRLFESTQDLILPEGSYCCDTYFGFIKQTTILAWEIWLGMIGHFEEAVFRKRRKLN